MATVLLAGDFGNGNPGDEALLEAFASALPGARVAAITRDPARTAAEHACAPVPAGNPVAIARAALRADAVVLCGRSVFGAPQPFGGRYPSRRIAGALALILAARARARPRAVIGATVDPLRTPLARRLARGLVRWSDLLVLRDDESAQALLEAGAAPPFRIGADPAWTVLAAGQGLTRNGGDPSRDRGRVAVVLGPPAAGRPALERLAEAVARVQAAGVEVVLQPWQSRPRGGDDDLARLVAARVDPRPQIAASPKDLGAARSALGRFGLVVGLRYHAQMAAAAAGVPFLTLEDRPELMGLAARLGQPVANAGAGPDELATMILSALEHPPPTRAAVDAQVSAAEEGLRLLRVLTLGGDAGDADRLTGLRLVPEPRL
jgi:polysaccharide pyruvyl transferase WcaK-like protein